MTEVFKSSNIPDSNLRGGIHIENHIMWNYRILQIYLFLNKWKILKVKYF